MSVKETLREKEEQLVDSYQANVESALNLQRTLERDILPGLVDELGLDGEGEEKAKLWLNDLQSIFRLLRRHKFTVSFALENARDVLLWRLAAISAEMTRPIGQFLQCLPVTSQDPYGRPIVVIKLWQILQSPVDVRPALIHYVELLRLELSAINTSRAANRDHDRLVLQYIALVDIGGLSVQDVSLDLMMWFIYELVPRFPGMLAAAFILNYSWAHSGVWNIIKRALPKSALSRVFFPSQDELLDYLSPAVVPCDYGGSLPSLSELEDPLEKHMTTLPELSIQTDAATNPLTDGNPADGPSSSAQPIPRVPSISPYSHSNPYFGYPVSGRGAPTPRLRHGRQRKRDLLRTLAALWWSKWKHRVFLLLCVLLVVVSFKLRRTPRLLRCEWCVRGLLHLPTRT